MTVKELRKMVEERIIEIVAAIKVTSCVRKQRLLRETYATNKEVLASLPPIEDEKE